MENMRSIKKRLVFDFMLVILITVIILELILIGFVKHYYYASVEDVLTNQITMSSQFYSRYFANTTLEDNVLDNIDVFWKQTSAQVQIIDSDGTVLMDSIGLSIKEPIETNDFKMAIEGKKGTWIGAVDYDDAPVMIVSYPLKSEQKVIGVIRFITSLREADDRIHRISQIFMGIGLLVILISGAVSIVLANSIIGPIKEVTQAAEKMAAGNFRVRSRKRFDDEIGKLSDTLNYMAGEILKKDELKNDFISSVSHEIRTPLTAIKGWAIVLNKGEIKDSETIQEGLGIIEKESERLTVMVEELLDFSKFASGKITLNKEETDIEELIQYIVNYMAPRADRDEIEFIVECEKNLPLVWIDGNRTKQVLINVLDNAFKFTDPGGQVYLFVEREDQYVCMTVKDQGCGISMEDLPKVKDKFFKGKTSKSQNGIGLSVCDEIMNLHQGDLEIHSELGMGTTVHVRFPIDTAF